MFFCVVDLHAVFTVLCFQVSVLAVRLNQKLINAAICRSQMKTQPEAYKKQPMQASAWN